MAIKGKSRPRARRSVTRGPRPAYVHVKRPLVQRRGFQLTALAVVVVAAVGAIVYGFVRERNANHQEAVDRVMRTVMTAFSTQVQNAIGGVGQPQPPTGFVLLPNLKADIQGLGAGSTTAKTASADAATIAKQATDAADALHKMDPAGMITGKGIEDEVFVRDLINARFKMETGLRMGAQAATLLGQAADRVGSGAKALLADADKAFGIGQTVFTNGYNDWVNAQVAAGTFQSTGFGAGG